MYRQLAAAGERYSQLLAAHDGAQRDCSELEGIKQDLLASQAKLAESNAAVCAERLELQVCVVMS